MNTTALPPGPAAGFDLGGSEDSLSMMRDCCARYGDIYRIFAPSRGVFNYVINHPSDVKRVLLTNHRNYTKGEGMDRVKILLGNGIMTSEGGFWRRQRRMMQPSFHRRVLERFSRLIHDVNEKFAARWAAAAAAGTPINLTDDVSELILDIVLGSIFGTDLERLERQAGGNPFEVVAKEQNRDLKFAFRFRSLSKLVNELIERRRRLPEEHVDFLAMLMAARDRDGDAPMSNKEMIDEVMTLIVAGHETTAAALTWAWYLISQHPETATRIEAEADRVTPDRAAPDRVTPDRAALDRVTPDWVAPDRVASDSVRPGSVAPDRVTPDRPTADRVAAAPLGLDAAESLSFTHQVLKETLRLYPPGWLFTRRSIEADELGGFAIAPRTDVFICPYLLHRHPQFWSDPEQFRPERFAGADAGERHQFAYIPFSVGPRHCIGENLAMFEMLVHIESMARRFRLTRASQEPIELEAQINLRPRTPLLMTVKTR